MSIQFSRLMNITVSIVAQFSATQVCLSFAQFSATQKLKKSLEKTDKRSIYATFKAFSAILQTFVIF